MRISIITVTYNSVKTLEDTILSVVSQTYQDIEYIIIDGASTDGTLDVVAKYKNQIAKVVSEPDSGIYDAMNKGIAAATGDVIGFLHADDLLADSSIIEKVTHKMTANKADALYGDLVYVKSDNVASIVRNWKSGLFNNSLLKKGWMPPHPTLYIKRDLYQKIGLFNMGYKIAADYDFILRLLSLSGLKVVYLEEVMVRMRLGGASNGSIGNIIQKSKEDLRALKSNGVGGVCSLIYKNFSKIPQFFKRT